LATGNFGSLFSLGVEPEPAPPPAARRLRRQAALRETFRIKMRRLMRVFQRLARPERIADLPATFKRLLRERIARSADLPDPRDALPGADGLAGLAPDLSPAAMMEAYGKGLAPSASLGPVAWHSRAERLVAAPAALARDRHPREGGAGGGWTLSFDRDVDLVLARSGRPCDPGPIMPGRLLDAFAHLFDAGFVHCFAVSNGRGEAIGGGFGVAVGGVFMIEGAYQTTPGAAAFGLCGLNARLAARKFALVERAPGLGWLDEGSFEAMTREDFAALLARHMDEEQIGRWREEKPATLPDERRLAA
jgi:leucyl/phenylalanyl-tRNA---protein transferase